MAAPPERTLADARAWVTQGTALVERALAQVSDAGLAEPTELAGWTRAHLVAHLAANAEALLNLVHWARTGVPTPMYSSPEQRHRDIEAGSRRPAGELRAWLTDSAARLDAGFAGLTDEQWAAPVVTAQGRTVPASETPWMRTREVAVHAVDLAAGVSFANLPTTLLAALLTDVAAKRSAAADGAALSVRPGDHPGSWSVAGAGDPVEVTGSLAGLAAYLCGRAADDVCRRDGTPPPSLPRWL